jgi:polyhydroxybutyrate depolymerase
MSRLVRHVPLLVALASGAACPAVTDEARGEEPGADAAAPDAPGAPPRCAGRAAQPRDATWTLTWGGVVRHFDVHVPASYDPTRPTPVVLDFHGYTSNASQQALLSRMNAASDAAGYVAVHPQGSGSTPSWNAGACCGSAAAESVDDIGFVDAMLDALETELCIDPARVYATGFSNGGFLAYRLACERADRIAAIAPVAGVLGVASCAPSRPVPVLHFHGTLDTLVPYQGSDQNGFPSVHDTVAGWAARNGCAGVPAVTFAQCDTACETHAACAAGAEVTLCTITGGGHTWPGGLPLPGLGHTTSAVVATDAMWAFFERHPRPPAADR